MSKSSKEDYTEILLNFNFEDIDFSEIEYWEPQCYTRNCFYKDDNFELILICWDKGQKTAIHDHDGEDCWVYLLEGKMEEDFY
ncbi:MAG: cysteine dioxygenase family protein, partial [Winogradskyella sp.]|nr:cysteine dioxygenase family protein [Winogradskyella sp.]